MVINIKLDENAILPTRAHPADAGFDIYSPVSATVYGYESKTFDTGVHIEIPSGYVGLLLSRSGMNIKKDIISEGVIDSGYTGSIKVRLHNLGESDYHVDKGDRISQLLIIPIKTPTLNVVDKLAATPRGNKGIGSTGR